MQINNTDKSDKRDEIVVSVDENKFAYLKNIAKEFLLLKKKKPFDIIYILINTRLMNTWIGMIKMETKLGFHLNLLMFLN